MIEKLASCGVGLIQVGSAMRRMVPALGVTAANAPDSMLQHEGVALLVGVLYLVEPWIPREKLHGSDIAGVLALHLIAAIWALAAVVTGMFSVSLVDIPQFLLATKAEACLYTLVLVVSLARIRNLSRRETRP